MTGMNDLETRLRATLSEHATNAPPGGPLAERILAEMEAPAPLLRPRHGWRTWSLPLLAAGAVAAIVAAVVGIDHLHTTASPQPALSHGLSTAPTPTVHTSPAPHTSPTPHSSRPRVVVPPDPAGVTGFRALDLTFVSETQGWALGSASCATGRCTALFRTINGKTWTSMPGAAFNLPGVKNCAAPCVEHLRFATDKVGYAFGPDALFMTLDGGSHWSEQTGGADALETLNNNVIRLVSSGTGCPGPCNVRVETSGIGSTQWTTTWQLPPKSFVGAVQFARAGADAYVLVMRNPADGGSTETSALYVSTDNGASWKSRGEPCPQAAGEADSTAITAAPTSVSVLCLPRGRSGNLINQFAAVSTNEGSTFQRAGAVVPTQNSGRLTFTGDPSTELFVAAAKTYRSGNGGATWQRMRQLDNASWLGFESPTVGRAVTDGGRTISTTHDDGQTWSPFRFG